MNEQVDQVLEGLHANAALPFESACAMPPGVYTNGTFLDLEQKYIFASEWICVGRQDAIGKPGDYLTYEIAGQPVVVVRDEQCELRAYSNVCRHRMSLLMNGQGNCRRMICPYHGWTYDLQGGLAGAPRMDRSPAFDKRDYRLPEIRLEIWQGWIYLTLNPDARPVADRLSTLHEKIQSFGMADYVETFREEHLWNTNWKILAENFMESYHLPVLHRGTVGSHSSLDDMECPAGEPAYNYHWIKKEASLAIGNAHPDNKRLQGHWRQTTALIAIYPSHLITLTPGYFWYLSLQPREVGKVHITFGGGLAPEFIQDPEGQQAIGQLKTLLDEVNREDRRGVEAVFKGTQAIHAKPGHLCHLERPNYDFAGYLSRCLQGH
jgi:phenylpropionate dioxygenase-like ring-hydroxylating dioxygenase large terminal subunit